MVEDVRDVMAIENTSSFRGLYHVLGGKISPMDGIGPNDLNITSLVDKVKQGETLSAIARKYQISLAEIKSWNNLTDGDIKVGQTLLVKSEKTPSTASPAIAVKKEVKTPVAIEPKTVPVKDNSPVITAKNYSYENSKEINETGLAGWINDKNSNPKKSAGTL